MKVCLVGGTFSSHPEFGGAYTFESEILDELIELMPESQHTFVFFDKDNLRNPIQPVLPTKKLHYTPPTSKRFKFKSDSQISQLPADLLKQMRKALRENIWFKKRYEHFKLNALKNNDVDITLALSPSILTMDIPFITVVWDLAHHRYPYFPEVSVSGEWEQREKFYSTSLKRASFVITGTQVGKTDIERFYQVQPERIRVLPFPTPAFALNAPPCENQSILEKYQIPENFLLYPAQFWPHKNHVGLLRAVRWLRDKCELSLPVVFVGSDKGNVSYIKQVIDELGLAEQVFFLGFIPQIDLVSLYRKAFALVFLSFFGPDNLPPLEAMALGCPVIASNVEGAQEYLGDAALLTDPQKTEQIALAIKTLWHDNDLRQMLITCGFARARQWVTKDYIREIFSILDEFECMRQCWSKASLYR